MSKLKNQKGSVSILGAGAIFVGLFGFSSMIEFANAKILDRELDNHAKVVAMEALRSELAITKEAIDSGDIPVNQTELYTNKILQDGVRLNAGEAGNLQKMITFGNFDAAGNFVALTEGTSNPKALENVPNFSAVAVQLISTDSFMGVYTPEGRALYGLSKADVDADSGCYCKNRYQTCLVSDLDVSEAGGVDSVQRKNYCNYGMSESKVNNVNETKYPYIKFNDGWVGRPPTTVNFWMFYSQNYDGEAFDDILKNKSVMVTNGDDPLENTSGWMSMMSSFMSSWFGGSGADLPSRLQNESKQEKRDLVSSIRSDYICEKPGFMMFPTTYPNCESASNSNDVVLNDKVYIGYQGTCISGTNSTEFSTNRCLSYNDSGTQRFESCLEIERRSSISMNFFQRMMAFFMGPWLNWERSYEGLDCEVKKMRYVGWMFWGGWKDVE
ncbi:hypothetical protein [Thiomicrorhabdus indica]|uniref:hypothetical protein n=1 Tax=Thiomicrorhabdus indica TaxID=2267253 RepID=UPI002AA8E5E3|nr:hypothetical protein [Thiomicrorhabdus indica]